MMNFEKLYIDLDNMIQDIYEERKLKINNFSIYLLPRFSHNNTFSFRTERALPLPSVKLQYSHL